MERIPEPELMDDEAQAKAYAEADFEGPNTQFVRLFEGRFPDVAGCLLDLGCGPGDISLRFARAYPALRVHGLDGSDAMLRCAERALASAGELRERVSFIQGLLPGAALPRAGYEAVVSNSLLHHLHRPQVLWETVRDVAAPGAAVLVMDLLRPPSPAAAQALVERYAANEPPVLRKDFYNSLLAAFTVEEVGRQLVAAGLAGLELAEVSDRHFAVWGRLP